MKKTFLSLCGETTIYSIAICNILLERGFNYLLYSILHVQIGNPAP